MAKVNSLFKLRGTIGGLTFRQTESGTVAQSKPGPTREQVLSNKSFDVTRRNAGEFKLANKNAMLLRRALDSALDSVKRPSLNGHVIGLMHRMAMLDGDSEYGYRTAGAGDISLLTGFDFSKQLSLDTALPVKFEHGLNAKTGVVKLEMPSFIVRRKKVFPEGATHFRIVSCAAVVDFARNTYKNSIKKSELLPLSKKTPDRVCLEHMLKAVAGEVLVQVMGIEFYKVVNGEEMLLKGGAVKILEAVRISLVTRREDKLVELNTQVANKGARSRMKFASCLHVQSPLPAYTIPTGTVVSQSMSRPVCDHTQAICRGFPARCGSVKLHLHFEYYNA